MFSRTSVMYLARRWKHKKSHWSMSVKKKSSIDRALENFDDFYGSVYGNRYKSMRAALLTEHKYVALVNNFGDVEKTTARLELDGAINMRTLYNLNKQDLNEEESSLNNTIHSTRENKVNEFFQRQRSDELAKLYPGESDLDKFDNRTDPSESKSEKTDYKKSLEQSIQEDSDVDVRRIVDGSVGTTGLYDFVPATKIKGLEDFILESDHYKYYQTNTDFPLQIETESDFQIPENLHLYTYEMGNVSRFPSPKKCITGVLSHFCLDGASVLPPLALGLQPGDRVLDACAAPGGKSLVMLQSLYPDVLVCNDLQESRVNRIKHLLRQYIFDFDEKWRNKKVYITQSDARSLMEHNVYDKILVDVPCTTDRHVLNEEDNNIFKPSRVKERLNIPQLQADLLSNCIQLLRPGGSLVYSTCSLSPVQNDGVVQMALTKVFTEKGITVTIKDLTHVMKPFAHVYKFEQTTTQGGSLKYGQMVLPYLPANFGPMYFCKIVRNP